MRVKAGALLFWIAFVAGCQGQIFGPSGIPTVGSGSGNSVGGGSTGGSGGRIPVDAGPPAFPYEAMTPGASVSKVKNLLTGLPPSDAEVSAVARDPGALRGLVAQWITLPEYQDKMLAFFGTAFQQDSSVQTDFSNQVPGDGLFAGFGYRDRQMLSNYREMFGRTALELIAEGRPFTETYTTTRFMLTPALAGAMATFDSHLINDTGMDQDLNAVNYPGYSMYLETAKGPIPSAEAIDPTSPNYLQFYTPSLPGASPSICQQDPLPYVPISPYAFQLDQFEGGFFGMFLGRPFQMGGSLSRNISGPTDAGTACPPSDTSSVSYGDFEHWRMVNIRQPHPGEKTTPFFDFDSIRSARELVLSIPRVGFFTTPSFLAVWNTNASNQFRVTINQALIVGLNQSFDGTDGTVPQSLASVDQAHASATTCFACHQQLDPMRQFFRHDYSLYFHQQTTATADNLAPPQFAWAGISQQGGSIFDLGRLLAQQPHVAATWVQNLCQWANSSPCVETDPEFIRIATVFQRSNFSWNAMVTELFSSPLITYAARTQTSDANGETYGITRRAHLCDLLSSRLGLHDVCGLQASTVEPYQLSPVQAIASSYPSDAFSRGRVGPVLANDPSLFLRAGLENSCIAIANMVIDNGGGRYSSGQPQVAISDFVHNLMGLTSDRAGPMLELLQAHYAEAVQNGDAGIHPADALKSTFVLACLSPYVAGLGQ